MEQILDVDAKQDDIRVSMLLSFPTFRHVLKRVVHQQVEFYLFIARLFYHSSTWITIEIERREIQRYQPDISASIRSVFVRKEAQIMHSC